MEDRKLAVGRPPGPVAPARIGKEPLEAPVSEARTGMSSFNGAGRGFIFKSPSDLVCPITRELFVDPVANAEGQTYEREAIEEALRRSPMDPMTRKSLKGRKGLTPVLTLRRLAMEYRQKAATSCLEAASRESCDDPMAYLRRAAELVDGVNVQVPGMTNECIAYLRKLPSACQQAHTILELIAKGLKQSGRPSEASELYRRALRMQQAHILEECVECLFEEHTVIDNTAIEKYADIVQDVELHRSTIIDSLRHAGADDKVISRAYQELLSRSSSEDSLEKFEAEREELKASLRSLQSQHRKLERKLRQKEKELESYRKGRQHSHTARVAGAAVSAAGGVIGFFHGVFTGRRTATSQSAVSKKDRPGVKPRDTHRAQFPPIYLDARGVDPHVLTLSDDGLTVTYSNVFNASVRGSRPVPSAEEGVFYFEVAVLRKGMFAVGFAGSGFDLSCAILGYGSGKGAANSYGYWGTTGNVHDGAGDNRGKQYGEGFGEVGDVVGAGIDLADRRLFFTKNGKMQGWAVEGLPSKPDLYPSISFWHVDKQKVRANFGQERFWFDLDELGD